MGHRCCFTPLRGADRRALLPMCLALHVVVASWENNSVHGRCPKRLFSTYTSPEHDLPEAYEEQAFAGVRWRIRGRTLAHGGHDR